MFTWRDLGHPLAGGAEVYTHEVTRHWALAGHDVTIFTSAGDGRPAEEDRQGVRIVRRGGRHSVYREARRFYEREARGKYDLVIDQINTRPFLCPRFVDDAPIIALVHQVAREVWFYEVAAPMALFGRFVLEPSWLRTYRNVPTVTVSESSRRSLERYGLQNITVVPEGFDVHLVSAGRPPKEATPTLIYVGRLSRNKRPHHTLKAFVHVHRQLPAAQLWIVGTGPLEAQLRRQAGPGVSFYGWVDDAKKRELLARANVLVVTSVREGWGLNVTEAARLGTPAIGYNVDGLRDSLVAHGGALVEQRPRALADRIVRALTGNATLTVHLGEGSVLPWEAVATRLLATALTEIRK